MAHKLPTRGTRAKTNKGKRVKAKTVPTDPKPKTTAAKKAKAKKMAMPAGKGMKRKNA